MPSKQQTKKRNNKKSQNNKSSKSKSRKSNKINKRNQRGGTSSSCTLNYANKNNMYNAGANIHNTNPQASLDLDSKFIAAGRPVPLGSHIVGGGTCGSEGVGTKSPKTSTFKDYISGLDDKLSAFATGGNPKPNSKPNSKSKSGGGYTPDPSEYIAGRPVIKSYDDNSPPAIIGGKLVFGSPDKPICGNGAVRGGSYRKNKKNSKNNKYSKKNSKKNNKKNNKYSKKSEKSKNNSNYKLHGGEFTSFNSSKPAEYKRAFDGKPGVFKYPDNMMGRTFGAQQPEWNPSDL